MSETNPPAKKRQCDALDMKGKRCRGKVVTVEKYHGDPEIYTSTNCPSWVRVELCEKHRWENRR